MSSPKHSPQSDSRRWSPKPFRAHFAAVGALIVSIGFLLVVLSLVADDVTGLVLVFVWVFVIAFFGWFFVTRRGYRRLLVLPAILWALINTKEFLFNH